MNKSFFIIFMGCLLLVGCHKKQTERSGQQAVDTITTVQIPFTFDTIGFNDHPDKVPSLSIDVSLELPVTDKNNPIAKLLRRQITIDVLGEKYAKASSEVDALMAYITDQRARVSDAASDFEEDQELIEDEGMEYMYKWESNLTGRVFLYNPPLLIYEADYFDYEGGVHGMFCNAYMIYSTITGKRLKLDDVFVNDKSSRNKMATIIYNRLQYQIDHDKDLEGMEILDLEAVKPVDNFSLNQDTVTFYYAPYEIAAYCYGEVAVKVPVADLRPYMLAEGEVAQFLSSNVVAEK